MATDFTNPFILNSATNPWPSANTVSVSSSQITSRTLTLTDFNPNSRVVTYGQGTVSLNFDGNGWNIKVSGANYYTLSASGWRGLPTKPNNNGLTGASLSARWNFNNPGTQVGVNTLYIKPVATDLTPWERRRKINLEG